MNPLLSGEPTPSGRVVLAGAGPGDPDAMTLASVRACEAADVIYHDRLAAPVLAGLRLKPGAQLVDVGKQPGDDAEAQRDIEVRMAADARAGRLVVRLKGGDPFIFGRGGEEMEQLLAQGIAVETIPGVSAVQAAAVALGVPLTHREVGSSLELVTAHDLDAIDPHTLAAWGARAAALRSGGTLALYMGLRNLPSVVDLLLELGVPEWMPAALVERASQPGQRLLRTRLATLATQAGTRGIQAPAIALIGRVVLRPWTTAPGHEASATPVLILGTDASLYHDEADAAARESLRPTQLRVASVSANRHLLSAKADAGTLPASVLLPSLKAVVAMAESMQQAGLIAHDLASVALEVTSDAERIAARRLLGLNCTLSEALPKRTNVVRLQYASGDCRRFPVETTTPEARALAVVPRQLGDERTRCVVVCDPATAFLVLPMLLPARAAGASWALYARDRATQAVLAGHGMEAAMANRLRSVGEAAASCPAR